jgi:poly-gamma-glutamate synthesis protein (capsule biosynthesis protein)
VDRAEEGTLELLAAPTIFLCGDVMTGRGVDQILPHPSAPQLFETFARDAREYVLLAEEENGPIARPVGFAYPWGAALELLNAPAIRARVVNLETSVTGDGQPWAGRDIHYRMHPDNVPCLQAARFDVCALANNHMLDWGYAGLLETLEALPAAGVRTAGAGRTLPEALRPARVPLGGGHLVVFAFGDESSGVPRSWAAAAEQPGVAWLPRSDREIDALVDRMACEKHPGDICIASVHWGSNWGYDVEPRDVALAHALIDGGVDVVHGHSSHHPRPLESYRRKLVLYGCGDFLNDYEGIHGHEHFRSDLVIAYLPQIDPATGDLVALRMVPMRERRMRLERASAADARWMAATLTRISRPFRSIIAAEDDGTLVLRP